MPGLISVMSQPRSIIIVVYMIVVIMVKPMRTIAIYINVDIINISIVLRGLGKRIYFHSSVIVTQFYCHISKILFIILAISALGVFFFRWRSITINPVIVVSNRTKRPTTSDEKQNSKQRQQKKWGVGNMCFHNDMIVG
jgi:hypothetical protein